VIKKPSGQFTLVDLNQVKVAGVPANQQFDQKLTKGGYEAAHFIDQSCDGALAVEVSGLALPALCAFSLVTAVDFFPLVDQVEIGCGRERVSAPPLRLTEPPLPFRQGGPKPLGDGRFFRGQFSVVGTRR